MYPFYFCVVHFVMMCSTAEVTVKNTESEDILVSTENHRKSLKLYIYDLNLMCI